MILPSRIFIFSVHGILKNYLMFSFYEFNNSNLSEDLKCQFKKKVFCFFAKILFFFPFVYFSLYIRGFLQMSGYTWFSVRIYKIDIKNWSKGMSVYVGFVRWCDLCGI